MHGRRLSFQLLRLARVRAATSELPLETASAQPRKRYCASTTISLRCTSAIGWSDSLSFSGAPFTLECTQHLNQRSGRLFHGFTPQLAPSQGDCLCARATLRTAVTSSGGHPALANDDSGVHTSDFGARLASGVDTTLVAGKLVCAQFWPRDPASSFQSSRSEDISLGLRP